MTKDKKIKQIEKRKKSLFLLQGGKATTRKNIKAKKSQKERRNNQLKRTLESNCFEVENFFAKIDLIKSFVDLI